MDQDELLYKKKYLKYKAKYEMLLGGSSDATTAGAVDYVPIVNAIKNYIQPSPPQIPMINVLNQYPVLKEVLQIKKAEHCTYLKCCEENADGWTVKTREDGGGGYDDVISLNIAKKGYRILFLTDDAKVLLQNGTQIQWYTNKCPCEEFYIPSLNCMNNTQFIIGDNTLGSGMKNEYRGGYIESNITKKFWYVLIVEGVVKHLEQVNSTW